MLKIAIDRLIVAASNLNRLAHDFANMNSEPPSDYLTAIRPDVLATMAQSIGEIKRVASALKLDASLSAADRCISMLRLFSRPDPQTVTIQSQEIVQVVLTLFSLNEALSSQIASHVFYALDARYSEYVADDCSPFGELVATAFPTAQDDIVEAGKCLALERYTAVVFHLMRAMEIALREVAAKLDATVLDSSGTFLSWGVMAENVKRKIQAMEKGEARNAWHGLHSHFDSVNRAWRNKTMHPQQSYTAQQSIAVLSSTRTFLQHLAPLI